MSTSFESVPYADAVSLVAEGVHTALRKGTTSVSAQSAHLSISQMPDWSNAVEWFVDSLESMGIVLCKRVNQ